jgi:hypothetical protein
MSKLSIMGDKGKEKLGEADLDMAQFSEGEPNVMRLKLSECEDPDAFIEVGLKATEHTKEDSATPRSSGKGGNEQE